ncbi:carboxyl transferase domain-containing protein [Hoyosella altamirensis]|uniref:biotin carboxylase n=1 Tax=Hoyosella altamirensis TaxID=616997 RepID=A0A839RRA1_9ACTN|nr:biotin carboxylase N-terminal domain-containing protein [Hoyosella altamirensis]MBB3038401.1 acetyl/propionyl-CoA carboxylase alpha subunit/acetyl-CoA carboxylase carboxyltransferase component [Hoyosella altamirensis]
MFKRIAIVNRGEAAVRLIRAVRELNAEHNYGIRVVALHTEAERGALFVRQADEGVTLRPSTTAATPYLDHAELERALVESKADAVWVGWGFVAEDPNFADLCARLGITFIGPNSDAMRLLGDKVEAKLLAEKVGVPVAPWSGGPVETRADARRHAHAIGYPLIIKARSGGGGRGIRKVYSEDELELALERTQGEAQRSFGDPVVFIERLVTEARHVEVQCIADSHGNVWAPGVRDCSIQRKNQKVIEESSSPLLNKEQSDHLRKASAELVRAAGYCGAATVEYLYQPEQKIFTFLEVNTRLQVEHPITEATTGLDLVKLQIHVANGGELTGECPSEFGHAVEARLNAEDADNGFAPAPGSVQLLKFPLGSGLRVDTGIAQGDIIPPDYDSMVAKIIAWGKDRSEALARLRTALRETTVVLHGGTTTKSFLLALLDRKEVISASADTGWLDRSGVGTSSDPEATTSVKAATALLATAIEVYDAEEAVEREAFRLSARGGRPRASHAIGRKIELNYQNHAYGLFVTQIGPNRYRIEGDSGDLEVDIERLGKFESRVVVAGTRHHVVSVKGPANYLVEVDGISHQISQDEAGVVRAPAPAVVVAVPVAEGDDVEVGDTLVVLESMKMETAVRAQVAGRVREVFAVVNSQVDAGASLIRVDAHSEATEAVETPSVEFPESTESQCDALELLTSLGALLTGYDVDGTRARSLLAEYERLLSAHTALTDSNSEVVHAELALLSTFADICEISRNRPITGDFESDERVHSPREHFHTYLKSFDADIEGLPESFRSKLSGALRHYGVTDLTPSPELAEAVYRLFLALQRMENQVPVVSALLERWLVSTATTLPDELEEVLDRLITATQLRYPVIGDLARNVRFRIFDEPVVRKTRSEVTDRVRGALEYLSENPESADYTQRVRELTRTPEPLIDLLAGRIERPGPLLEVITRAYYKIRELENVEAFERGGQQFVTGSFQLLGDRIELVSTVGEYSQLSETLRAVDAVAPADRKNLVLDLYLSWPGAPADSDALAQTLLTELTGTVTVRRFTVTVFGAGAASRQFTFRPENGGLREDRIIRDMHPLTGQRLDLWRLKNFEGVRVPSAPDTFLFHLKAKENPADERLIALAEVRDATVQRDESGQVVSLPSFERTLTACLNGVRRAQAKRGSKRRLDANRVMIYYWPTLDLSIDDVRTVAGNLTPLTVGAGLEEITVIVWMPGEGNELTRRALRFSYRTGDGVVLNITEPPTEPLQPMDAYTQKVRSSRARGTVYPYELIPLLTGPEGSFVEYDIDESGVLAPVDRPYGDNKAGLIVGKVTTPTPRYPEGMTRIALFGDPTKALGTVAEAECSRLVAAVDLAEELGVPVEWFALSSGAKISMDSGTENMDWVSRGLRRLITFTQKGGEVNVIVTGINVGAQPYWNAESTMLMHTKGILVMTPDSAMVLTGKNSLDYSGGVSAEDNFGIGGYDRVMGPNGEAQYWAPNLTAACEILFAHYDHAFVLPGERFPRRAESTDPIERDVQTYPHVHPGSDFTTVGDIFSSETNPERKKPFDIRTVMRAVVDQDHGVLERWADMADADTSVVFDAHLGGQPVSVIGIESRAIPRKGWFPADGPDQWTSGTLFPASSKKTARAINAASGNRPLVVLANLSGFDGSPESLRSIQLEYGAEIGRAIVNFDGPIVFCVVSRYHGGAFVVFSKALNDNMEVLAIEGSFASVIGGAPAAAVVFSREVNTRTAADPTVQDLEAKLSAAEDQADKAHLQVALAAQRSAVRSEKLGEVAAEFEAIHNIQRAQQVGSVDAIIPAAELRPHIIGAVRRGMARALKG